MMQILREVVCIIRLTTYGACLVLLPVSFRRGIIRWGRVCVADGSLHQESGERTSQGAWPRTLGKPPCAAKLIEAPRLQICS